MKIERTYAFRDYQARWQCESSASEVAEALARGGHATRLGVDRFGLRILGVSVECRLRPQRLMPNTPFVLDLTAYGTGRNAEQLLELGERLDQAVGQLATITCRDAFGDWDRPVSRRSSKREWQVA